MPLAQTNKMVHEIVVGLALLQRLHVRHYTVAWYVQLLLLCSLPCTAL